MPYLYGFETTMASLKAPAPVIRLMHPQSLPTSNQLENLCSFLMNSIANLWRINQLILCQACRFPCSRGAFELKFAIFID